MYIAYIYIYIHIYIYIYINVYIYPGTPLDIKNIYSSSSYFNQHITVPRPL